MHRLRQSYSVKLHTLSYCVTYIRCRCSYMHLNVDKQVGILMKWETYLNISLLENTVNDYEENLNVITLTAAWLLLSYMMPFEFSLYVFPTLAALTLWCVWQNKHCMPLVMMHRWLQQVKLMPCWLTKHFLSYHITYFVTWLLVFQCVMSS